MSGISFLELHGSLPVLWDLLPAQQKKAKRPETNPQKSHRGSTADAMVLPLQRLGGLVAAVVCSIPQSAALDPFEPGPAVISPGYALELVGATSWMLPMASAGGFSCRITRLTSRKLLSWIWGTSWSLENHGSVMELSLTGPK